MVRAATAEAIGKYLWSRFNSRRIAFPDWFIVLKICTFPPRNSSNSNNSNSNSSNNSSSNNQQQQQQVSGDEPGTYRLWVSPEAGGLIFRLAQLSSDASPFVRERAGAASENIQKTARLPFTPRHGGCDTKVRAASHSSSNNSNNSSSNSNSNNSSSSNSNSSSNNSSSNNSTAATAAATGRGLSAYL